MVIDKLYVGIISYFCYSLMLIPPVYAEISLKQTTIGGFQPPPGRDRPTEGTASGGSRPVNVACLSNSTQHQDLLTAVIPGEHLGLTMMERPEFVVYLPSINVQTAELSIFDQQMQGVYQMNVSIDKRAGFVSVRLPDDAPTLVQDKPYYWTFALICNERDRTEDLVVGGWIERTQINYPLQTAIAKASFEQKISLLAKNGYWYDAVIEIFKSKHTQVNQHIITRSWQNLLKSVGLNQIAKKTIHNSQLFTTHKYHDI